MYAIMGVTGKVGGAAARALLAADEAVRVVVRDHAKGKSWAEMRCGVVIADVDDAGQMAQAFEGAEGAFAMLPPLFDPSPGFDEAKARIASLRDALARSLPKRLVALSTIGANAPQPNLLNQLGLMEQALSTLPIPVTFLRAAWFMENAALDVGTARDNGAIASYLQPLDRVVPMISAEEVGRTVADLLREPWDGVRVVELEATRRVSPNDIAAAFAQALGKPVQGRAVPRDTWERLFREQGMRNPLPRMQMLDGFNEGWIEFAERGAHARRGLIGIDQVVARLLMD
jgi:uncharacterized protein YbjT (DUF2867 family)